MPQPLIAALPLELVMESGYVIKVNALDPTTGAEITGVRVTDVTLQVRPIHLSAPVGTDGADEMPLLVPFLETV